MDLLHVVLSPRAKRETVCRVDRKWLGQIKSRYVIERLGVWLGMEDTNREIEGQTVKKTQVCQSEEPLGVNLFQLT